MPDVEPTRQWRLRWPSPKASLLALGLFAGQEGIAQGLRAAPAAPASAVAAPVEGLWRFVDDGSVIMLGACNAALCGILHGLPPELRGNRSAQAACGAQVLSGFVADGPDRWVRGQVFDPATGSRYSGSLRRVGADRLELQVGSGLLSSRLPLERHPGTVPSCAVPN